MLPPNSNVHFLSKWKCQLVTQITVIKIVQPAQIVRCGQAICRPPAFTQQLYPGLFIIDAPLILKEQLKVVCETYSRAPTETGYASGCQFHSQGVGYSQQAA